MTHKERAMVAISYQQPDRVPKGELAIANDLLCENIGKDGDFTLSTCNILIDIIPMENVYAMYGAK